MTNLSGVIKQFSFVVEHDAPVVTNARELSKLVVDMETGQKGFIITGKEEFLEPYLAGKKRLQEHISKLRSLLSDDERSLTALSKAKSPANDCLEKAAGPEINARQEMNRHPETLKDAAVLLEAGTSKKIFDKFYREDASNTAIEGTGLGMTVVKYIVEAHGGKVWVESGPGKGTAVCFTIPT